MNEIENDIAKGEGSFVYDSLVPVSYELEKGYKSLDEYLDLMFAQTSAGEWLEKRAEEHGVIRKTGKKATTDIVFSGTDGVVIPANIIVATESGLEYYTQSEVEIVGGVAQVLVEAENVGDEYNVPANIITQLPIKITGVKSVTNPNVVDNGEDVESDEALLNRFLFKVRNPSTSGNNNHYLQWALDIIGIGDAEVFPLWAGDGTVKLVLTSSDVSTVSEEKLDEVRAYIDKEKPIGATVTIISVSSLLVNITVDLILKDGYDLADVEGLVEANIIDYIKGTANKQGYVSYALIGSVILGSEGVFDYQNLLMNGSTDNINIGIEEVAELGSLVIS